MPEFLSRIGWPDIMAPLFFIVCWMGYAWSVDETLGRGRSLMSRMHEYRHLWMRRMLTRENRMVDLNVVGVLAQSNAFFASSAVLIVGGCLAVLGSRDQAMQILAEVPFVAKSPPLVWEMKVLLLVVVFVYAFFQFTWSLRKFNYVAILIGGAPGKETAGTPESEQYAKATALMASLAAQNFNGGLRAFYFGLAALSWFLHPYLFILLTAWVVLIIYRREFRSNTLKNLGTPGTPIPGG